MRKLMLMTVLGLGLLAPSAYATPLVPKVLIDTFPANASTGVNFFEAVNCAMLRRGQRYAWRIVSALRVDCDSGRTAER